MSAVIPPSEEVISMYQRDWDIQQKKTQDRLKTVSNTVYALIALATIALVVWAGIGLLHFSNAPEPLKEAAFKDAVTRVTIALIATVTLSTIFELAKNWMNKMAWEAAKNLGDRPRNDDHKADDYEMLEVSSYYTPDKKFIASVNGWSFLVTRLVNQTKDGKHTMDFAFDEIGRLQTGQERMGFGSSATMDTGAEIQQNDIICMALSKIAHQYPALQMPPAVGRYVE